MRRQAVALADISLEALDDRALSAHADEFFATLLDETPLRRLHEVVSAQSRAYMFLEALITAWVPTDADAVLKRLMTGLGTLPNVRMTYRLMDLAALAVQDSRARAYFTGDLDEDALAGYETALAGTAMLAELRAFLREFGHRVPTSPMSCRPDSPTIRGRCCASSSSTSAQVPRRMPRATPPSDPASGTSRWPTCAVCFTRVVAPLRSWRSGRCFVSCA